METIHLWTILLPILVDEQKHDNQVFLHKSSFLIFEFLAQDLAVFLIVSANIKKTHSINPQIPRGRKGRGWEEYTEGQITPSLFFVLYLLGRLAWKFQIFHCYFYIILPGQATVFLNLLVWKSILVKFSYQFLTKQAFFEKGKKWLISSC